MRGLLDRLLRRRIPSEVREPLRRDVSPFTAGTAFLDADPAPGPPRTGPRLAAEQALCPVADVAVVGAALAGSRIARFVRCLPVAGSAFEGAEASRDVRLRALMALRTRVAAARRTVSYEEDAPAWARGRLPAAKRPLTRSPTSLPPALAAVVDAATTPVLPVPGPAFGAWHAPGIGYEHEAEAA